ncbi:hypothetical protein NPIL_176771 [Nephila pilipes]|uniref:Uncharacterized protein n=1 Tax=Nephila pilipes TaxID=299642 RepID=A0A8X6QAE3_NEPPI|nr:hypothetical protein NPIL_176771 [Nephila pilipes]
MDKGEGWKNTRQHRNENGARFGDTPPFLLAALSHPTSLIHYAYPISPHKWNEGRFAEENVKSEGWRRVVSPGQHFVCTAFDCVLYTPLLAVKTSDGEIPGAQD